MINRLFRLTLLTFGIFCFSKLSGQADDCISRLDNAEILFNSGIFEDIPLLIEDCLVHYSDENKKKAYRLLVLAYYMNDDIESAEEAMDNLLSTYPEYKPPPGEQADFLFVFQSFRVRKIMDLGFMAGPIFTPGNLIELYSPFQDKFSYLMGFPGVTAGIFINKFVNPLFSLSTEPSISQYKFHIQYENYVNGIYAIDQAESNTMLNLPLHGRFSLSRQRLQPYIKLGGKLSLLIAAETESRLERFDPGTGDIVNASESIKRDHSEFREKWYYYVGGGIGLRWNFNKFYVFTEADYYHPLNNMLTKDMNRFEQVNLWSEAWIDSDFRIIHASLRFGISRRLYGIKKIR